MYTLKKLIPDSFLILFIVSLGMMTGPIFADDSATNVSIGIESSPLGCQDINECYIPYRVSIDGTEPTGLEPKGSNSEDSEYAPGTLVVTSPPEDETTVTGISTDGKVRAEITASNPKTGEKVFLEIKFRDSNSGAIKKHANYDLFVSQNGKEILSSLNAHKYEGIGVHETLPLNSTDSVDIKITLHGFGFPGDQSNWEGPRGEILMFKVVPEFGTLVFIVMFVAISSVVLMSSKYGRLMPKP